MRMRRYGLAAAGVVGASLLLTATPAFAQDAAPEPIAAIPVNLLWVVIGAVLVIFMQAGFALVETGFCRAKHASHVVSTNFAIFGLGFIGFFFVGYPLAFGGFDMQAYFGEGQGVALGHRRVAGQFIVGDSHSAVEIVLHDAPFNPEEYRSGA